MPTGRVEQYLKSKNWSYKASGSDQFRVDICPICGDVKGHFFINQETGKWDCKKCGEAGGLLTLQRKLGDIVAAASRDRYLDVDPALVLRCHDALLSDSETMQWLSARLIAESSVIRYRLGLAIEKGNKILVMPYFENGKIKNLKYRTLPPQEKNFWVIRDYKVPPFGCQFFDRKNRTAYVCEGELDAVLLAQRGYLNVLSVPLGAKSLTPDSFEILSDCQDIYLLYDNDGDGRAGAKDAALRLGPERCHDVLLPVKDITDFFMDGYTDDDLKTLIEETGLVSSYDVFDYFSSANIVLDQGEGDLGTGRFPLPWTSVNRIVGPLNPGMVLMILGIPAVGKTTFTLNMAYHWAHKKQIPTLVFCPEMDIPRLVRRIAANHRAVKENNFLSGSDILTAQLELGRSPLYLCTKLGREKEAAFRTIEYAVRRYGIQCVIFDNIHFICRNVEYESSDISATSKALKLLAGQLNILLTLIVHTRKIHESSLPTMYDSRGSAALPGDADVMLAIQRKYLAGRGEAEGERESVMASVEGEGTFSPETTVYAVKSRDTLGGRARMIFRGSSWCFEEI